MSEPPPISELYLAFRQAKAGLYYERRGVGLCALAKFEHELPQRLESLQKRLGTNGGWFDELSVGDVWVVPKRLRADFSPEDRVIRVGVGSTAKEVGLDIQLRCTPSAELAIAEVLFLWRFGPLLDRVLLPEVLGYRLAVKRGVLRRTSRWLFNYWPKSYDEFKTAPLETARRHLSRPSGSVLVLSADLASYYDTVDARFLLDDAFVARLFPTQVTGDGPTEGEYREAVASLLRAYGRFHAVAEAKTGLPWKLGIPIGPLTSRLVANLALASLDEAIAANSEILTYRRYVDDMVIVAKADPKVAVTLDEAVMRLVPCAKKTDDGYRLDCDDLGRSGSEFSLQRRKVKIHHLAGIQGLTFVEAVADDFRRLVSERRSFLDPSVLLDDTTAHLVRAGKAHGSPLRVLRDADRARLERFALSTTLRSMERVSSMVDPEEAKTQVRLTLDRVVRILDGQDNWVENLDLVFRLLGLAVAAHDWESCRDLLGRMDRMWGTTEALRTSVGQLFHRGRPADRSSAWTWLRNYLHERRLESVLGALPTHVAGPVLATWLTDGLLLRTRRIGPSALRGRARLLAASDLRARDREDDASARESQGSKASNWMTEQLSSDTDLLERLRTIAKFTDADRQVGGVWGVAPARLFLSTRPPSYFDIARRWLVDVESDGFERTVFEDLIDVVNAIRGTEYADPVGSVIDARTVAIPPLPFVAGPRSKRVLDPRLILGNLVTHEDPDWVGAATRVVGSTEGRPVRSRRRLRGLAMVLRKADAASRRPSRGGGTPPPTLLVLPELSIPRSWFRTVARYVVQLNRHGLVAGLEYEHLPHAPIVENQAHAVLPGPYGSAASWAWTKGSPAREEGDALAGMKVRVGFAVPPPRKSRPARIVVRSQFGDFSVLICSELIEAPRIADLLGRVELLLAPSWNPDTSSYDHLIRSVGFQLNAIVAVANNGHYSDCRAWAPRTVRWQRDLCRLIERDVDDIVTVDIPLRNLKTFRAQATKPGGTPVDWRPLPPEWP